MSASFSFVLAGKSPLLSTSPPPMVNSDHMTALRTVTETVTAGVNLSRDDVAEAVCALLDDVVADEAKADFLTALARKGESAEEFAAFALELRARAVDPQIDPARFSGVVLDIVGTGADMTHTFNISSCTVFVAAAAGVAVAKHGNRAITSKCGSADVLAALGARIELSPEAARHCLDTDRRDVFLCAALSSCIQGHRPRAKETGGAQSTHSLQYSRLLVNPARPTHQLVGVFNRALVGRFAESCVCLG